MLEKLLGVYTGGDWHHGVKYRSFIYIFFFIFLLSVASIKLRSTMMTKTNRHHEKHFLASEPTFDFWYWGELGQTCKQCECQSDY